jgi:hypothetical protein
MSDRALTLSLAITAAFFFFAAGAVARGVSQGTGTKYQVVKVCSLLSVAEVKKLAPWPPHLDSFAKGEEEPVGSAGSSCNYPTVFIQVMAFNRSFIDELKKAGMPLEPVPGVGEEAYVRDNRGRYAELVAKVGPHSLTVQLSIESNKTFESTKPSLIAIGKAYAARLR